MAFTQQLSDIHFEPLEDRVKVSLRCFGEVSSPGEIDSSQYNRLAARIKYLAGCMSHLSDIAQEGAFHDKRTGLDVRVSTFPTDMGERLSMRLIQPLRYRSLDSLGWKSDAAATWRRKISGNAGLFIISGAVGSGKTTALYASLAELAGINSSLRVVTLEDPVEGRVPGICQSSLDSMRDMTLAQAFKHLLRQDPDVIALGEIRDKECLQQALQAGLSGHCVLATFHAGRGRETLERIRQMGIEDYLVLSGLKGILHLELEHKNTVLQADAEIIQLQ
jgi:type II secretory ATPase GspE/PulE/Tfp pilus assembly ATPase PilB-like protein